ncbi:FecR family protein [Sphingobium sp. SCG-1]|uniref:FecR family protein n=1 Tax=Sphingobium sp. SCG-1 TaxID=2072936 RepID=UPI001670AB4D|nr:FecR domain-containing protein [Sphingobium sp. SCG-1]
MGKDKRVLLNLLRQRNDSPEDQAAGWVAYLYSGETTEEGRSGFSRWLGEAEVHVHAYRHADLIWRNLSLIEGEKWTTRPIRNKSVGHWNSAVRKWKKRRTDAWPTRCRVLAAAGAIAATLLLMVGIWRMDTIPPVERQLYASVIGQVKIVILPDGSQATLRPESTIVAQFSKNLRRIELTKGGAYFEVVHDARRPFFVRAALTQVRVVGTHFDVTRWREGVAISVTHGIVNVERLPSGVGKPVGRESPWQVRLAAGQQAFTKPDGRIGVPSHFDPLTESSWQTGRLNFRDTPLNRVVQEINRYREVKVRIDGEALGEMRVTASMDGQETSKLLSALEATRPLTVEHSPNGLVLHPEAR